MSFGYLLTWKHLLLWTWLLLHASVNKCWICLWMSLFSGYHRCSETWGGYWDDQEMQVHAFSKTCLTRRLENLYILETQARLWSSICRPHICLSSCRVCWAKQTAPGVKEHSQTGPWNRGVAPWQSDPGSGQGHSERQTGQRPHTERPGHCEYEVLAGAGVDVGFLSSLIFIVVWLSRDYTYATSMIVNIILI